MTNNANPHQLIKNNPIKTGNGIVENINKLIKTNDNRTKK